MPIPHVDQVKCATGRLEGDGLADNKLADRTVVISGQPGHRTRDHNRRGAPGRQRGAAGQDRHPTSPSAGDGAQAAAEIEAAGGKAHAVNGDVRREENVRRVVDAAVQRFGGIDVTDLPRYGGGEQPIPDLFLDK